MFNTESSRVSLLFSILVIPVLSVNCAAQAAHFNYAQLTSNNGFSAPAGVGVDTSGNTIGATTQSVTVFNYLFGPRYTFRTISRRFLPYAQALGQEISNYTAVQNLMGPAFSVGGGVSTTLRPHFGWTIAEGDSIQSRLPNAQNNLQNDLRISSGFTFRLGQR